MSTTENIIVYKRQFLTDEVLTSLYSGMLYARLIEEKMLNLLRQGKISKWFSGIGQEAISVGATMALMSDEMIFPMHRNLGVFTSRMIPLRRLVAQWQGKESGFTKGRDRSFHFGSLEHSLVGMISHLGPQLSLATGVALAEKLDKTQRVSLAFTGEGATSEGEFHEALNLASVWKLPVIFVIENNGYALSTPTSDQYACRQLADRGIGYGIESHIIDGNNVLEVYHLIKSLAERLRQRPEPILVECKTFRMRGHEEASGTKYVPPDLMDEWSKKDPIENFVDFLRESKILDDTFIEQTKENLTRHIAEEVDIAFGEPDPVPDRYEAESDVFATSKHIEESVIKTQRELRYIDSIHEALDQAMAGNDKLVFMGQDIASYGGVFKATEGLSKKYGRERVRDTPLCESAVIGAAIGLSLRGYRSMVEMQFSDFVTCGFNQIVNNLAKMHYRWGHAPKVLIRMPTGGNVGAGPFHSQNTEAWFAHTPGIKILYPSTAYDAKGLLMAGLQESNPVMFFEHKYLYRTSRGAVPEEPYAITIGKARYVSRGRDVTIISYGLGVYWALEAVKEMSVYADIIDLRTLHPIDWVAIQESVEKTGKVIVLHEASLTGGIGAEIAAYIGEHFFEYLDAPVMRCASLDTPVPFAKSLETDFLPPSRFKIQLKKLLSY